MKKGLFVIGLCWVSACTTSNVENSTHLTADIRYTYANRLAQQGQLSQALVQWQILALRYPNNTKIKNQIATLEDEIETRVEYLQSSLAKAGPSASADKQQKLLLKILALQPNHTLAKDSLRQIKSQQELAKVTKKNHSTYQLFAQTVKQAKQNKRLSDLLHKAQQQLAGQQYASVLTTTEEIQQLAQKHPKLASLNYAAWLGLANQSTANQQAELTIRRLDKALEYATVDQQQPLKDRISAIQKSESGKLYASAMKIFKADIHKAVKLLQKAAALTPDDTRTMQQLSRAQTIEKNLNLIKNASP